jgi:hypothetical protein
MAECETAIMTLSGGNTAGMSDIEQEADNGEIPACAGLTKAQIAAAHSAVLAQDSAAAAVPTTAAPSTVAPTTGAATTASPPTVGKTVATYSGSGIDNTPKFTVTATWKLDYSFDCSSFGSPGNFQVYEDGGNDLGGLSVNDLAMSKTGSTYAYDDGGTHYLEINSECSWTVKIIDEGS